MNTNTKRAAAITAALIVAGTLAACGDDPEPDSAPAVSEMTDEEKWAAADAEKAATAAVTIEACIASDQADPETSAKVILGISSERFCKEMRADDPLNFDIWYSDESTDAEKMAALDALG